jgi:flagellar basal-body rod protein FlgF
MIKGIYTTAAAMQSRVLQEEVTANNLANMNTTGFKKDMIHFKDLLDGNLVKMDLDGGQGSLNATQEVTTSFSQGQLRPTHNALDAALDGDGFFVVLTDDGEAYTRNGHFVLDADGRLLTAEGHAVLGASGPLELFPGEVEIKENGEIHQNGALVDELRIADLPKPYAMRKIGEGLFVPENPADLEEAEGTLVRQGYLEDSNVNPISEMVRLIAISKSFETGQKSIQAQDRTLERAVNGVGKY